MENLRKAGIAVLGTILLIYVFGTLRLVYAIISSHGAGQSVWSIIGGLYIRLMIMAFFLLIIVALARDPRTGTKK